VADLDTRSKRASSVGILSLFVLAPPLPDGTIDQGDRQHIAWSYSGILAGAPPSIDLLDVTLSDVTVNTVTLADAVTTTLILTDALVTTTTLDDVSVT
jgi:hypothetical protein